MSGSTSTAEVSPRQDASAVFRWPTLLAPALCGLLAMLLVLTAIDVRDDLDWSAAGPGLTFDEGFNAETGVYLVESFRAYGLAAVHPSSLMEIYGDPAYNPDHPPLGRIVLGLAHAVVMGVQGDPPGAQRGYVITYARIGSAFLFGLTVALAAWGAGRWFGHVAGIATAVSLILTPRLFGHAHIAALETAMGCAYLLALVVIADRWSNRPFPGWKEGLLAGIVIGLAFLTKIQAVLLPPLLTIWALWHWRLRAFPPLIVAGLATLVVFFAGWPWLWIDPIGHTLDYFLRAAERQTVYCYYWGERFADRDVPWHYPWVMFLVTTPLPLLALLGLGLVPGGRQLDGPEVVEKRRFRLLALSIIGPLALFTIPGSAVYDGERLFLIAWPPAAMLMGRGAEKTWNWLTTVFKCRRRAAIAGVSAASLVIAVEAGVQAQVHPCQLSYYNLLTGGLKGAADRGFEVSYWGDGVTADFLNEVLEQLPQNATLDVTPVLHPLTLEWMRTQQLVTRPDVVLRGFDLVNLGDVEYVLAISRRADTTEYIKPPPDDWTVVSVNQRSGVPLTALYKITRQ